MSTDLGTSLDLTGERLRVHVVGIGGAGMRAIASVLAAMGHHVSGSDLKASPGLDQLGAEGVTVHIGHDAAHLGAVDLVTRSTAVPDRNPEIAAARAASVPLLSRADVLAAITRVRPTISVAGTHGKTTTASMLAVALMHAGVAPSFIIGGEVNDIGSGAAWSAESEGLFVVEADESDGTFLRLDSTHSIVTSVEPDHLAHYGGEPGLRSAFDEFVANVSGTTVVCHDEPGAAALESRPGVVSYGTTSGADYRILQPQSKRVSATFSMRGPSGDLGQFTIATAGLHNVRNAAAAIAMATELGIDVDLVRVGLARFAGVARRFQHRGERAGVVYIDDYAHLPSEVSAVLDAVASGGWGRVVCVFQPHRYTRTRDLWSDFADSFDRADELVITGIYTAGEVPIPGVTGQLVVDAVRSAHPDASVRYVEHRSEVAAEVGALLQPGDLCLTLGAGDLTTLPDELLGT